MPVICHDFWLHYFGTENNTYYLYCSLASTFNLNFEFIPEILKQEYLIWVIANSFDYRNFPRMRYGFVNSFPNQKKILKRRSRMHAKHK